MTRARSVVIATGLVVVAATVSLAWMLVRRGPDRPIGITVAEGASAQQVLDELGRSGLMPSSLAGRLYLATFASGRSLRFGHYTIPPRSRPVDALELILAGQVDTVSVTIVEGSSMDDVVSVMAAAGFGDAAAWNPLLQRTRWIDDLAPQASTLEGFLFPDTYRFAQRSPAERVARHLVNRFREVWREERSRVKELDLTSYETVILASLVEAETSVPEERARVAGVFRNRLERGMLLQCDPTVAYALQRRGLWEGRLLRVHWQVDDPYNTYLHPGLPPGPINNPGRAALAAALAPEEHGFLYFVASPGGGHTFSRTLREHNRAVATLRNARR